MASPATTHTNESDCAWKENWPETKRHFADWWNREGLVVMSTLCMGAPRPHENADPAGPAPSTNTGLPDPAWRARDSHFGLSRHEYPLDMLPIAGGDICPGSLALFLGAELDFTEAGRWLRPTMTGDRPETSPPLRFDPQNKWWKIVESTLAESARLARGKYLVGCPDLLENIDILAALRGTERLFVDMTCRGDWVLAKLNEINEAFFEVYDRIYEIIKLADGSSAYEGFALWGPGKTAKVECDASAMFSPAMFARFVVPALTRQCRWLDHSMFHLDGSQCIGHLDALLAVERLDAIEFTPEPKAPDGGSPEWYDLYRRVLRAGKSLQAVNVKPWDVVPLLDAIGGKGVYVHTWVKSLAQAEELEKAVEPYR